MRSAIAFAAIIIVFGIFMPDVLHALTNFLLVFLNKATAIVQTLPASPADLSYTLIH